MGPRGAVVVVIALAAWLTACGGSHHHTTGTHEATVTTRVTTPPRARLTGAHPCPGQPGFSCSTLDVPLDHAGQASGMLRLAADTSAGGPRRRTHGRASGGADTLLSGERDLSTPLAWARQEAAMAPDGQLLEVPGAGHSVQLRARDSDVRRTVGRFLATG